MKIFNQARYGFYKSFFALTLVCVLAVSAMAQRTLHKALDFDGDGKADPTVFRQSNNVWFARGSSNGALLAQQFGLANADVLTPGDYNNDGRGDFAVWREESGTFFVLTSNNFTFSAFQWGTAGDEPVARDYDGDGQTDFAVVRPVSGQLIWYIFESQTNSFRAVQFGIGTDVAIPGDYDGDGRFDLGVQRPITANNSSSQANVFILGTTSNFFAFQYGIASDFMAPGDYNGNGTTDFAAVRETSEGLIWYIFDVRDNSFRGVQFGVNQPDFLVQGDYDGRGATDIAVWRDDSGVFFILSSETGEFTALQWGLPGDIPVASYDTH